MVVPVVVAVVMVAVVVVIVTVVVVVVVSIGAVVVVMVGTVVPTPKEVRKAPELTLLSGVDFVASNCQKRSLGQFQNGNELSFNLHI